MGLFALLFTVFIAMSYASNVLAAVNMQKGQMDNTVRGEVVAVDNLHPLRILTLRTEDIGEFPNDSLNIFLNQNTILKICSDL